MSEGYLVVKRGATWRFRQRDTHSRYVTAAGLLLSLTLVVDLVFRPRPSEQGPIWALLLICLATSALGWGCGARLPKWVGIAAVAVFVPVQAFFLLRPDDPQSVVSTVQQLPVVGFYLGWFVRPRIAYAMMLVCVVAFGTAMFSNPLFAADGAVGVPVAVQGLLSLVFCFAVGAYLWLRADRLAATDPLTGAVTRQGLTARIDAHLARGRAPFCVVAIDFDDFKRLNAAEGHAGGDVALRDTVALWRTGIRAGDVIVRVGGDEFVFLLPNTSVAEAGVMLARLDEVSLRRWSWGAAAAQAGDSAESLLRRADEALFAAKRTRREERHG